MAVLVWPGAKERFHARALTAVPAWGLRATGRFRAAAKGCVPDAAAARFHVAVKARVRYAAAATIRAQAVTAVHIGAALLRARATRYDAAFPVVQCAQATRCATAQNVRPAGVLHAERSNPARACVLPDDIPVRARGVPGERPVRQKCARAFLRDWRFRRDWEHRVAAQTANHCCARRRSDCLPVNVPEPQDAPSVESGVERPGLQCSWPAPHVRPMAGV